MQGQVYTLPNGKVFNLPSGAIDFNEETKDFFYSEGIDLNDATIIEERKMALKEYEKLTKEEKKDSSYTKNQDSVERDEEILNQEDGDKPNINLKKKYVIQFKKGMEEEAKLIQEKLFDLDNSPIGEIPIVDVLFYFLKEKWQNEDKYKIREMAFQKKANISLQNYNRENKVNLTFQEYVALKLEL